MIDTATISSLPRQFWTLPKNRAHFETQVMMLLTQDTKLIIPKPKAPRIKSAASIGPRGLIDRRKVIFLSM